MHTGSNAGSLYFLTKITVEQRYQRIKLLCDEIGLQSHYLDYISWMERHTKMKVWPIHTGYAVVFHSTRKWLENMNIILAKSLPVKPQSNKFVEEMSHTLFENARLILGHVGLLKRYWRDVISHAAGLHSRVARKASNRRTPMEALLETVPDSWLRQVFCNAA